MASSSPNSLAKSSHFRLDIGRFPLYGSAFNSQQRAETLV